MGQLTTHVLDTASGRPAGGRAWTLHRADEAGTKLASGRTNNDGRNDGPVLEGSNFSAGTYEFIFFAGDYFRDSGADLPEASFLDRVVIRFGIADPASHYHVPLLVSPYGYSTYRGS